MSVTPPVIPSSPDLYGVGLLARGYRLDPVYWNPFEWTAYVYALSPLAISTDLPDPAMSSLVDRTHRLVTFGISVTGLF